MTSRPHWFGMPAFEDAVLDAIIHEQPGTDLGVRTHGLRLKERNFTGAGLYSNFFYEDEGIGSTGNKSPGLKQRTLNSNVFAIAPGTDDIGLGLILFLEGDRVRTLEAHTYGPTLWWGHVEQFSLYRSTPNAGGETRSWRPLQAREKSIIGALCDAALTICPDSETLDRVQVREIGDPEGAIRFFDIEGVSRCVGRLLTEAEYKDDDGATVRLVLWLDNEGNLFGLDMWKPDFTPLLRYPTPGNLNIRTVAGARIIGNANLDMFDMNTRGALAAGRDRPDNRDRDGLAWLQSWYLKQCNGEWEHGFGVDIDTLDNPGWHLKVQIEGTPLEGRRVDLPLINGPNDRDWIKIRSDGETFEAMGGPSNLDEILNAFRRFAENEDSLLQPGWAKPH